MQTEQNNPKLKLALVFMLNSRSNASQQLRSKNVKGRFSFLSLGVLNYAKH